MTFQVPPVQLQQASGVQGDRYDDSPWRSEPFILGSALASYNIIGATAFSLNSDGTAGAGNSGSEVFLGILCNSKEQVNRGSSSDPFAPSMTLPNGITADIVNMGCLWVLLPDTAAIGDLVIYNNTTGALDTIAPGADLPVGSSSAYAVVDRFAKTDSGDNIAVIRITVTPEIPVLASPDLTAKANGKNGKNGNGKKEDTEDKGATSDTAPNALQTNVGTGNKSNATQGVK